MKKLLARNERCKKALSLRNLSIAAMASLAFVGINSQQTAMAADNSHVVLSEAKDLKTIKGDSSVISFPQNDMNGVVIQSNITHTERSTSTGFAADLTPTIDALHAADPENYPKESAYEYVDSADAANTNILAPIPEFNEETGEVTGVTTKYVNLKQSEYGLNSQPTLDRLHAINPETYPNGSAYTLEDAVDDSNTGMPVVTQYTVDKTNSDSMFTASQTKYLDLNKATYANGDITYSWYTDNNRLNVSLSGGALTTPKVNGSYDGDFVGNNSAVYNYITGQGSILIDHITGDFIKNGTTNASKVIYNYATGNAQIHINNIQGNFIGNIGSVGGVMYNFTPNRSSTVRIDNINGDFIGNYATSGGGAIYNSGAGVYIGNITGDFIGNSTGGNGGAIANSAYGSTIANIIGNFIGNMAENSGGAISGARITNLTGNFIGNTSGNRGGALDNIQAQSIVGNFIANEATSFGGAIFNSSIKNITGDFIGNISGDGGGAYYGIGNNMDSLSGNFIANKATSSGGAIYGANIKTLTGDFIGNSSGTSGGAIYYGYMTSLDGDFIGNTASNSGGAIDDLVITTLNGDFIGNSVTNTYTDQHDLYDGRGGAIANSKMTNLNANFIDNTVSSVSGNADGGAIYNTKISDLVGNFVNNVVYAYNGNARGGAIYNVGGNDISAIGNITGDFIGNHAEGSHADGGAIYNHGGLARIGDIVGDFIGNYAISLGGTYEHDVDYYSNEGIYQGNFAHQYMDPGSHCGGAIYNVGATIGNITGDFKNNYYITETVEANGGAIYNNSTLLNTAKIGDIQGAFENNYAISISGDANGGAIYNSGDIGNGSLTAQYYEYIIVDDEGNVLKTLYDAAVAVNAGNGEFECLTSDDVKSGNFKFKQVDTITMTVEEFAEYYLNGHNGQGQGREVSDLQNQTSQSIDEIIAIAESMGVYLIEDNPAEYNEISIDDKTFGIINSSFVNNYAKTAEGVAHGGAVYTTTDMKFVSTDGHVFLIDSNYVEDNNGRRPEAIYLDVIRSDFQEGVQGEGGSVLTDPNNWTITWYDNLYYDYVIGGKAPTLTINAKADGTFVINDQIVGSPSQEIQSVTYSKIPYVDITKVEYSDYIYDYRTGEYVNPKDLRAYLEDTQEWTWMAAVYNEATAEWKPSVIYWKADTNDVTFYNEATTEWITAEVRYDEETGNYLGIYNKDTNELITNIASPNDGADGNMYYYVDGEEDPVLIVEGEVTTQKQYICYDSVNDYYVPVDDPEMETITLGGKAKLAIKGDETGKVYINNNIKNLDITHENVTTTVSDYMYLNQTDDGSINSLAMNSGTLNLGVMGLTPLHFENFSMNGGTINIASVDVDLANKNMGRITADTYTTAQGGEVNVNAFNLLSDGAEPITAVAFADESFRDTVKTNVTEAFTPIYRYEVEYDTNKQYGQETEEGYFVFKRPAGSSDDPSPSGSENFNPAVLASPVATQTAAQATMNQAFQYVFEHADAFTQMPAMDRFARIHNNEYALSTDFNNNLGTLNAPAMNKGVWVRPYTSFDKTELKNGPDVKSINYGTIVGADTEFRKLRSGWTNVGTGYVGYFGSQIDFDKVDSSMNGGLLGVTETFYKGNFFTALTTSVGGGFAENHTMYGKEDITTLMAGVASKTGYNFEFKEGKFIVQPILMMNYTMVNTFDYTNAAGVKIDSKPMHTVQINPNVRFMGNLKGGWQPYASVGMVWNLMNETDVRANGVELPGMRTKPYVEYGLGIQRHWNDRFTAFGQAMVRNGGRTGVAFTAGFRWALGKDEPKDEKNVKLNEPAKVIKGERSQSTGAAVSTEPVEVMQTQTADSRNLLYKGRPLTKEEIAARAANLNKYNDLIK